MIPPVYLSQGSFVGGAGRDIPPPARTSGPPRSPGTREVEERHRGQGIRRPGRRTTAAAATMAVTRSSVRRSRVLCARTITRVAKEIGEQRRGAPPSLSLHRPPPPPHH